MYQLNNLQHVHFRVLRFTTLHRLPNVPFFSQFLLWTNKGTYWTMKNALAYIFFNLVCFFVLLFVFMGSEEFKYCYFFFQAVAVLTTLNSRKHLNFFIRISYSTFFLCFCKYWNFSLGQYICRSKVVINNYFLLKF